MIKDLDTIYNDTNKQHTKIGNFDHFPKSAISTADTDVRDGHLSKEQPIQAERGGTTGVHIPRKVPIGPDCDTQAPYDVGRSRAVGENQARYVGSNMEIDYGNVWDATKGYRGEGPGPPANKAQRSRRLKQ